MQRRRTRNAPKLSLSSRLHWATRLLFVTNWTWRYNVHPSPLRMLFLFGWPPCQRSDMTLVEVSQHAYDYSYIRTIVLFVFLRNSCKPDMVLVYILLNKLCLSLSLYRTIFWHVLLFSVQGRLQGYHRHWLLSWSNRSGWGCGQRWGLWPGHQIYGRTDTELYNLINSSRPSDAYMRQWSDHHWFR